MSSDYGKLMADAIQGFVIGALLVGFVASSIVALIVVCALKALGWL